MKKIIISIVSIFIALLTLASCGTIEEEPSRGGNITATTSKNNSITGDDTSDPDSFEYTVTLMYKGGVYPSEAEEEIEVIWTNRSSEIRELAINGVAKISGVDAEYNVHLSKCPKGYTYDPNINVCNPDNRNVTIELMKLSSAKGRGTDIYSNIYQITNITIIDRNNVGEAYAYKAVVNKYVESQKQGTVYYQFEPRNAGIYTIESMVDINDNNVNPIVDIYYGESAIKRFNRSLDDGGTYKKGGYTKNFKYQVEIPEESIGGVFAFGIRASSNNGEYPVEVIFKITYEGYYESEARNVTLMYGDDCYLKRDESGNLIYTVNQYGEIEYEYNYVLDSDLSKQYFSPTYAEMDSNGNYVHYCGVTNTNYVGVDLNVSDSRYMRIRYSLKQDGTYSKDKDGNYVMVGYKTPNESGTYIDFANLADFKQTVNGINYQVFNGKTAYYNPVDGKYHDDSIYGSEIPSIKLSQYTIFYSALDGYYHYGSLNGPRICAKIRSASSYLDALVHIEDPGNSALRVNGKEFYKRFVEGEYADLCNSDGACYLTPELKEFLQKLSNAQGYFFDGIGWCEQDNTFAKEDDQWMFACGFYQ